jgi:RimJ/RimL family protein N-acetyltransferase
MQTEIADGICLTDFRPTDVESLVKYVNDRDIYDRTLRIPYPYAASDAERWLGVVAKLNEENGQSVQWAIRREGEAIGGIGLQDLVVGRVHSAEIGYWLAKSFWGNGIMTAAVKPICQHAFENLGLVRIHSHVFSFNAASARVLTKCGFEQEGYLRKHFIKDGKYIDAKVFGLVQ